MQLTELSLIADDDRIPDVAANRRMLHIGEGITAEIRARELDAPFWKIVVWVRAPERRGPARRPRIIDRILHAEWYVDPAELLESYRNYREIVFDGIAAVLQRASAELSWDAAAVLEGVNAVRARDRPGLIELTWLRKRLPHRASEIRVFHEVTEADAQAWAEIHTSEGDVERIEIRREPHPIGMWASLPGFSAKVSGGDYVVRRKDGREILRLHLDDQVRQP